MISVIICTRNRSDLLDLCIESLLNQKTRFKYDIVVVDNNSDDNTADITRKHRDSAQVPISYYREKRIGLSYARNTGYQNAESAWVAYVDDDAKAHPDFVEIACRTIKEEEFDSFGGIYNAWFKHGKPDWLPDHFGSNRNRMPEKTTILTERCFSGGVAVYHKKVLDAVGGFPIEMGMKGEEIAYGEENYVQNKAREIGFTVGFTPHLQIDHLVREDKLEKSWHYRDAYQKGKARALLQNDPRIDYELLKYALLELIKYPFRLILSGSTFTGNRNLNYYMGYLKYLGKNL